jgi:Flp pilus assembly protein TadG
MEAPFKMRKESLRNEKGQVLIFVALAFAILGMFIGLAVDGGRAYLMRERLRSIVDAAALAGAKAMAGAFDNFNDATNAAHQAACDSAKVNGLDAGTCDGATLKVEIGPVPVTKELGVIVTGTDTSRTFFMALGGLIGCESCRTIDVQHVGVAVPDTLLDLVLVLDDTGTMSTLSDGTPCVTFTESGCPIVQAKAGANTLVDMMFSDPNSHARIAFVPFRGCYGSDRYFPPALLPDTTGGLAGCILKTSETQDLTNDAATLKAKINTRKGVGGYPGTNICLAMHEGTKKLLGTGSRAIARKVMVLLTDGDQTYSDRAWGDLGTPTTPLPYPTGVYNGGTQTGFDAGQEPDAAQSVPGSCKSPSAPGNLNFPADRTTYNPAINSLDGLANQKANSLKKGDPRGVQTLCTPETSPPCIEIYVLRFSVPSDDTLTSGDPPGACDPSLVGSPVGAPNRGGPPDPPDPNATSDDIRDRNLSRCLASNTANGDPFAVTANDHYFDAATAGDINGKFAAIASNILRKRRLVS